MDVTRRRATAAEAQIATLREDLERLEARMGRDGRTVDDIELENNDLRHENDSLRHENESLNHKIGVLLDVDDSVHHGTGPVDRGTVSSNDAGRHTDGLRRSLSVTDSEEHKRVVESLSADIQDWQRRYGEVSPPATSGIGAHPGKDEAKAGARETLD